jgi:hypothetical protein
MTQLASQLILSRELRVETANQATNPALTISVLLQSAKLVIRTVQTDSTQTPKESIQARKVKALTPSRARTLSAKPVTKTALITSTRRQSKEVAVDRTKVSAKRVQAPTKLKPSKNQSRLSSHQKLKVRQ